MLADQPIRTLTTLLVLVLACCSDDTGAESAEDVAAEAGSQDAPDTGNADAHTDTESDTAPAPLEIPSFDSDSVELPYCPVDEEAVEALIAGLTLREQIGQHLVVGVARSGMGPAEDGARWLSSYAIGGMFTGPGAGIALGDPALTVTFVNAARQLALDATGIPLFVALDQEGGPNATVNSLTGGTDTIGSLPIGATVDPQVAFDEFDLMAREVRALGFNMNFGPVLDTLRSTRNGNLNTRSFGPNPDLNAVLGVAAVLAM